MEEVFDDFIGNFWQSDRIKELERLADEHGWRFTQRERLAEQATALKGFTLFQGKRGKRIIGIMTAAPTSTSFTSRIYDYVYYSDGGKKKTTVIELTSEHVFLPPFRISPKKGIATIFNFKRRSSGMEKFTTHYQIESSDLEAVAMQIPDSVLELIADNKELSVEGDGMVMLYYYHRKLIPAHALLTEHAKASAIMDKLIHDKEKEFV